MREILFRGKSTGDLSPWIYGYYHFNKDLNSHYICDKDTLFRYEVIPETVGQSLNLFDKNSKTIFEGDLIRHTRNSRPYSSKSKHKGVICIVEWEDGNGGNKKGNPSYYNTFPQFNASPVDQSLPESGWGYDWSVFHDCEILGNKWDNPELLKNE